MIVEIEYFKGTGKYYSTGSYISTKMELLEIFSEVRDMLSNGNCPGLNWDAFNRNSFAAYIRVKGHTNNYPFIIVADGYGVEEN